jgi:adenine phosphoribosyltransferase
LVASDNVLIHDDLLATGGTANAAAALSASEAHLGGFCFIVGLDFLPGATVLAQHNVPVHSLVRYS